jgi:hypothetical protein
MKTELATLLESHKLSGTAAASDYGPGSAEAMRAMFRREFGPRIASRYFN